MRLRRLRFFAPTAPSSPSLAPDVRTGEASISPANGVHAGFTATAGMKLPVVNLNFF